MVTLGDDVRAFIEKEIIELGLGICDATKEEIDLLVSFRSSAVHADFTLADMISRRAQIGVCTFAFSNDGLVGYAWSFSDGREYLCIWRS